MVLTGSAENLNNCARNLPAVATALGKDNWNLIKPIFNKLANENEWKVRLKIASSLHEMARILGPKLTEEGLLDTFESCFNDIDEVRIVMVRNLSAFIFALGPDETTRQLKTLREYAECENDNAWRYRQALTNQLGKMIRFLTTREIATYIWPLARYYVTDQVLAVRQESFNLLSLIMKACLARNGNALIVEIKEFIYKYFFAHQTCRGKIAFIQLCAVMAKVIDYAWFSANFGDALLSMQSSKLKDIQIALNKTLNIVELIHHAEALKLRDMPSRSTTPARKLQTPVSRV